MQEYINEPDKFEFTARVVSCSAVEGGFGVVLAQSFFFPEAGGQPADKGTIDGHEVIGVVDGHPIVHILKEEIKVGAEAVCVIDERFRFENSQQHTGQHVLSALVEKRYGAASSSFKIQTTIPSTIEVAVKLTRAQLDEIEQQVFDVIAQRRPVTSRVILAAEDIPQNLRKNYNFTPLRIVTVEGVDECPCCGTHVTNTGLLGAFRIFSSESTSAGTKLYFSFGTRCQMLLQQKCQIVQQACTLFTCGDDILIKNIENLRADLKLQAKKAAELMKLTMPLWLEKNVFALGDVKYVIVPFAAEAGDAQAILATVSKQSENSLVAFYDGNTTGIVINAKNAQQLFDTITAAFQDKLGKCGGNGPRRSIVINKKVKKEELEALLKQ